MNKNLLILGAVMLLVGIAITFESGQQFFNGLANSNSSHTGTLVLGSGSTLYMKMQFNTSMLVVLAYNSTEAINFYLTNASVFNALSQFFNSSSTLDARAKALHGTGILVIYSDSAHGTFPYLQQSGSGPTPEYYVPNSSYFLPAGTFYAIFSNPNPTNTTVVYSIYNKPSSSINVANSGNLFGFGMFSSALSIIGIILIAWALLQKGKSGSDKNAKGDEAIERMYDEIEAERALRPRAARSTRKRVKAAR